MCSLSFSYDDFRSLAGTELAAFKAAARWNAAARVWTVVDRAKAEAAVVAIETWGRWLLAKGSEGSGVGGAKADQRARGAAHLRIAAAITSALAGVEAPAAPNGRRETHAPEWYGSEAAEARRELHHEED